MLSADYGYHCTNARLYHEKEKRLSVLSLLFTYGKHGIYNGMPFIRPAKNGKESGKRYGGMAVQDLLSVRGARAFRPFRHLSVSLALNVLRASIRT
jgi:hypothetical protein